MSLPLFLTDCRTKLRAHFEVHQVKRTKWSTDDLLIFNALFVHFIYMSPHAHLLKFSAESRQLKSRPMVTTLVGYLCPLWHACSPVSDAVSNTSSFTLVWSPRCLFIHFKSSSASSLVYPRLFHICLHLQGTPTWQCVTKANTWVCLRTTHFDTLSINPYNSCTNPSSQWRRNYNTLPSQVCPNALECNNHQLTLSKQHVLRLAIAPLSTVRLDQCIRSTRELVWETLALTYLTKSSNSICRCPTHLLHHFPSHKSTKPMSYVCTKSTSLPWAHCYDASVPNNPEIGQSCKNPVATPTTLHLHASSPPVLDQTFA